MKCPRCGGDTCVKNTRVRRDERWRRRRCLKCNKDFWTVEKWDGKDGDTDDEL